MNVAIILSSGSGTRFGACGNKIFEKIDNKPIVLHAIEKFIENKNIDYVLPVVAKKDEKKLEDVLKHTTSKKLLKPTLGGLERKNSSYNALLHLQKTNPRFVLIHDSARPFVSHKTINNIILNLEQNSSFGYIPCLPCTDTIKQTDENNIVVKTLNRNNLKTVQTPQGFCYQSILSSYKKHIEKENITDDASIFELDNKKIKCIEGYKNNIKITYKEDIKQMDSYIFKTGTGFDVHNFCQGNELILGGIKIPFNKKLQGHSDADVLLHALTDAILGSIAKGDIGDHFPDTDETFKDMDSKIFLLHAYKLLTEENASIVNIDITILAQEPKLYPYKQKIQENIANILKLKTNQVNVKASTTEKLGFVGRKEGIACLASVSVKAKESN